MKNPEEVLQASFIFLVLNFITHSVETDKGAFGKDVFHFAFCNSFRIDAFNR